MAPELSCAVANGQSPKVKWDNLAIAQVHCIVCDGANKVQPSCLILDIWPRSRAGILLLSHHLSSPLCTLWTVTGEFPAAALITVCLSFSISCPPSGASSPPGRTGSWMGDGTSVEQSAQCGRVNVWVLADILWCVPRVSALSRPDACCPYSFI